MSKSNSKSKSKSNSPRPASGLSTVEYTNLIHLVNEAAESNLEVVNRAEVVQTLRYKLALAESEYAEQRARNAEIHALIAPCSTASRSDPPPCSNPMIPEFIIEAATPPPSRRGMKAVNPLREAVSRLEPGQVLRWRGPECRRDRVSNAIVATKAKFPERTFTTRKEDGGYDVYRVS